MRTARTPRLGVLLPLLAATVLLAGCGSDNGTGSNNSDPIVASWQVTAFGDGTMDLIAQGMTLKITLKSDDTYQFAVTGDKAGICGDGGTTTCTKTGAYAHTGSQVTIDPGSQDATAFNYSISGNTMTWTGMIDTTAVTIVMVRTS